MTGAPVLAAAEQELRDRETPRWLRLLRDWKALAWPAIAALLAASFLLFGHLADLGKIAALGTYTLDKPFISQDYVMVGVLVLATLGIQLAVVVMVGVGLWALATFLILRLPDGLRARLGEIPKRARWGWLVLVAASATLGFGVWILDDLMRDADAMILKPAKELGSAWTRVSLDEDQFWLLAYLMLLVAVIAIFTVLSWWIVIRSAASARARSVYGTWAMLQVFFLVSGYAYIFGAGTTFQPYPIVTFSNEEQLCGKDTLPILLGSDDKLYAFLLLMKVGTRNETLSPSKVILYVPRSEVKWMTVLKQEPLHVLAYFHDLKTSFPAGPTNPAPAPDASSAESPKGNTPPAAPGP